MVTFANVDSVRLPSLKFVGLLKHRITRKLLKTDRYIHATYCVIVAGASPGERKMWAAVRENGDFLHLRFE